MVEKKEEPRLAYSGRLAIQPGQPIQVAESVQIKDPTPLSPLCNAIGPTLGAYIRAGRDLVEGEFAHVRELAPAHLRVPCDIYVLCCPDGVLVRYDPAGTEKPKVRSADFPESLSNVTPQFSENLVHIPDDPTTYVPENLGPSLTFTAIRGAQSADLATMHPVIYVAKALPPEFPMPPPSARPPVLASITRDLHIQLAGEILPSNLPEGAVAPAPEQFVAHAVVSLPVGWQAIELYPRLDPDYWKPEYAPAWAGSTY